MLVNAEGALRTEQKSDVAFEKLMESLKGK